MSFKGKALMLGNAGVGKTSILARYVDGKFLEEYKQTVGANFYIKEIDLTHIIEKVDLDADLKEKVKEGGLKIYLWDVGGQTDKLFVTEYYFLQAIGAFIVFDITNEQSFIDLDFWITKLKDLSGDVPFVIIGNKTDLEENRVISFDQGSEKAKKHGVKYIETSAKLDSNIDDVFEIISKEILNNIKNY